MVGYDRTVAEACWGWSGIANSLESAVGDAGTAMALALSPAGERRASASQWRRQAMMKTSGHSSRW